MFVTTRATEPMSIEASLAEDLTRLRERDLERRLRVVERRAGAVVSTDTGDAIDFSSNDYLGLATDPRVAAAAVDVVRTLGSGSTASRLIAGNTSEHEALEAELARFLGVESVLTFANGYAANTGAIPALVGRGDVIFADELNHASLIDGCRLSRADVHVYPHAEVGRLGALVREHRQTARRALIVTDGMFSMDGDLAPLNEIVALANEHDAWTYVDDAHAIGVLGENGRGSAELLGVDGEVDVLVGTLGKAFGAAGAFVAGTGVLRQWLLNRARSFVFSTGPMPMQAAAARAALRLIVDEPSRRADVAARAQRIRLDLNARGIATLGEASSHIIPVVIGDAARTMTIGSALAGRGFLVGAVRPPTVAEGTSRLRITASAVHTVEHIDGLCAALEEVMKK